MFFSLPPPLSKNEKKKILKKKLAALFTDSSLPSAPGTAYPSKAGPLGEGQSGGQGYLGK